MLGKDRPQARRPGGPVKSHCRLAVYLGEFTQPLWPSVTSEKWARLTTVLLYLLGGFILSIKQAPWLSKSKITYRSKRRETTNAESLRHVIHTHCGATGCGMCFLHTLHGEACSRPGGGGSENGRSAHSRASAGPPCSQPLRGGWGGPALTLTGQQ